MSAPAECPLGITGDERKLYRALARDPHHVFTKGDLIRYLDSRNGLSKGTWTTRRLDSAAVRLRKRLSELNLPGRPVNVWGVGYKLEEAPRCSREQPCERVDECPTCAEDLALARPFPTIHSSWQRPWAR